ncbi:MAG TPA: family 20 glycosylhydrolase [Puia sp.]|jgi:hexosaminidase
MFRVFRQLSFLLLIVPVFVLGQTGVSIIPEPVWLEETGGVFSAGPMVVTIPENGPEALAVVDNFSRDWLRLTGRKLMFSVETGAVADPEEGYHLEVEQGRIHISSASGAGVFYALQTLRQLLPAEGKAAIPCVRIVDYPRYGFRGMHLDVSRHFFSVDFIKKYLDLLAAYKLNTFHWHLTDSHGWRIEIKKYPRLTSIGAWRADRTGIPTTIAEPTGADEPATYGGFYTQEEIRDVVAYAARRYITIIPEIEIPGHCTAALVAYPEYSDLDNPVPLLRPCGYPGDLLHNLCLGYEPSFTFVEDILTEVMALFPGSFVHIGGDEVRGGPWLGCSRCRQRMAEKGFTTAKQYQAWFTHRIDSFINAHGKRTIGWDDILGAELTPSATAVAWHNQEAAVGALKKGHDIVMAPYHYTYFDFYQSDPRLEPDITYAGLGLDTVYAFEPTPPGLTPEENKHLLGGEACLWTENFATPARIEYMLLPRLLALAEVLWSPAGKKDYPRFVRKTEAHFLRFKAMGIDYATSMYNVAIRPEYLPDKKGIRVTLADETHLYPIRYTLDGSEPTLHSAVYTAPLLVTKTAGLRTSVFKNDRPVGKVNGDRLTIHLATGAAVWVATGAAIRVSPDSTQGVARLVDGIHGTVEPYDGRWVIFHDSVVDVVVDLKTVTRIHGFNIGCLEDQVGDMYLPRSISVSSSNDGDHYDRLFDQENKKLPAELTRHMMNYHREGIAISARYLKFSFVRAGVSPDPLKNQFVLDEITVQ